MIKLIYFLAFVCLLTSCSNYPIEEIKNQHNGKLKAKVDLKESGVKRFALDSMSAPKVALSQLFEEGEGGRYLSWFNKFNRSIYIYNYSNLRLFKKIQFSKKSNKVIVSPSGFFIKNIDSIYVYDDSKMELSLLNADGEVINRISLIGANKLHGSSWTVQYPQYDFQTAKPIALHGNELILTGSYMQSMSDLVKAHLQFIAHVNVDNNKVTFTHKYPQFLFKSGANWDGQLYTEVYTDIIPEENKMVFSFPISHHLYTSGLKNNKYNKVYGGSNNAGTITSIAVKPPKIPTDTIFQHFIKNDEYAAIKYDKYRQVYYRFLRGAITNPQPNAQIHDKPIVVIILDKNFNYLGETILGPWRNWNIANIFVTREGLNVEYIDDKSDESSVIFKLFKPQKI